MEEYGPKFNKKFVQIIEKYSVIYDHTLEEYSNRRIQEETWKEIGKELNESAAACKEKWTNLRSAYTRYLRQKGTKKKYYLAEYMSFLTPFTKPRQHKCVAPSPNNNKETLFLDEDSELEQLSDFEVQPENDENEFVLEKCIKKEPSAFEDEDALIKSENSNQKRGDPLQGSVSKKRCHIESNDADLLFLKSLLPDLHQMTNEQKYQFKCKTLQTIGEILYQSPSDVLYSDPNSISSLHQASVLSSNFLAPPMNSSSHETTPLQSPSSKDCKY